MCCSIDIVGAKGDYCRRFREAIIILKFVIVKFQSIEEEFIVSSTLGEGHIIRKFDAGGLVFWI